MKIGVLIRDFEILENWELRIIESIKNDPNFEISVLIKDGRPKKKDKQTIANFIFNKQISFEKRRYLKNNVSVNKADIIAYLQNIPTLIFKPLSNGNIDVFKEEDVQQVKNFHLDVILKHEFGNIGGDLLSAAKNGIWYIYHSDLKQDRSGPPGFWEVLKKDSVVGVSLLQLTEKNNEVNLIDKAFFNRHRYSYVETNFKVLESSVSLLLKNIQKLEKGFSFNNLAGFNMNLGYSEPGLSSILKYALLFYKNIGNGFVTKVSSYFGKDKNSWKLFIGSGNFMDADLSKLKSVTMPKNEFWADPFLFEHKNDVYVFFERLPYSSGRGVISCGKVQGNDLIEVQDVLDLPYHLSYPFVFEENGEIYMMPETSENKQLELYKCIQFPSQWELYSTAFEGEAVADAFFYLDSFEQRWLFLNKSSGPNTSFDNELHIYKVDSLKMNKLEAHHQNPIYIDSRIARNGGAFFELKKEWYRPSQRNTDGVYGKALKINRLKKLTLEEYQEDNVAVTNIEINKFFKSMHHLHQIKHMFVFDAIFKKL